MALSEEARKDATFERFRVVVAEYFELPVGLVTRSARLGDDLGLDSLAVLECVVMLEEVAGHEIELAVIETIRTIGDLYNFYWQFVGGAIATDGE